MTDRRDIRRGHNAISAVGAVALIAGVMCQVGCARETEPAPEPPVCAPFEPVPVDPLGLEAARHAHRRAELRRHLRFEEALSPGHTVRLTARMTADMARLCFADVYEAGRLLFEHEYSFADGLGSGDAKDRPDGPFRRVQQGQFGGPETISCTSCHWRGGPGGAGALQDNSFLLGDGERPETADARNPPLLAGAGVVQALAQEMTAELAAIRAELTSRVARTGEAAEAPLIAKGVAFGVLRVTASGDIDTSKVDGVDPDLVIRPFGWKGNFATLREFIAESLQVHFGIQSEDLIDAHGDHPAVVGSGTFFGDPDDDGVVHELTGRQLTALVAYVASLGVPVMGPPEPTPPMPPAAKGLSPVVPTGFDDEWLRGRQLFTDIGCATCHKPMLVLNNPRFVTRASDGSEYAIDLAGQAEHPRIAHAAELGGYPVWLFSDLKRHDMGHKNLSRYRDRGVAPQLYMTRRLWGLASSPPYFYDGRAPWIDDAIAAHAGDGESASLGYQTLNTADKGALRLFLLSLRREARVVVP